MNEVIKTLKDWGIELRDGNGDYRPLKDILDEISHKYKNDEIPKYDLILLSENIAKHESIQTKESNNK